MDDPQSERALVKITNPNPRPLAVWQGTRLVDMLRPRESVTVMLTAELRLSSESRSLVLVDCEGGGEGWDGEQWVQRVDSDMTPVHPDLAVVEEKVPKQKAEADA